MTVEDHLNAYTEAFNARDVAAALKLFAEHALFEMPLLGQRLVGRGEIRAGLHRIFEVTESARILLCPAKSSPHLAIAEGRLSAQLHREPDPLQAPLAMVLEAREERIVRLSTYLDARPYRLWADGPLFAATHAAAHAATHAAQG